MDLNLQQKCHGQGTSWNWLGEHGEDCIERKWPAVALDLVGAREQ